MGDGLLLGLDIGTSRLKALLIDEEGRSVRLAARPTPFRADATGTQMGVGALLAGLRSTLADLGDLSRVIAVGVAGLGESGAFVEADGSSATPIIAWHDPRGTATAARLDRWFGAELAGRTGRPARYVSSIAKIGWMHEAGADLSGVWLGVAGLVNHALTGRFAQERSLAATSGAYDPVAGAYLPDVLEAVGLGHVRFAPVMRAGAVHGRVVDAGSAWSGVPIGVPVTLAGHDHLVGAVGAGAGAGEVADSMGSGEPVLAALPAGVAVADVRAALAPSGGSVTVTAWPGTDRPALLWELVKPGLGLANLAGLLGMDRGELERLASAAGPQPPWPAARLLALEDGAAVYQASATPGAAFAGVLEGYAELTAAADRVLHSQTGNRTPTVVFGGGLRSQRWMAAKQARSATGLLLSAEPEATARGAALLAGLAASVWPDPDALPAPDGRVLLVGGRSRA